MSIIQYFKLINGSEIIGQITFEDQLYCEVTEPLSVEQLPSKDGREKIMLLPYAVFSNTQSVEISKQHIITKYSVDNVLETYYRLSLVLTDKHNQALNDEIDAMNNQIRSVIYDQLDEEMFGDHSVNVKTKTIN